MRLLGRINNDNEALCAQGLLISRSINCRLEKVGNNWEIWAIDEEKMLEARTLFQQFIDDPFKEHYAKFAEHAKEMLSRVQKEQELAAAQLVKRLKSAGEVFNGRQPAPLSWVIIFTGLGAWILQTLFPPIMALLQQWLLMIPLPAIIATGQWWRIITPVFLHSGDPIMGILHVGMNMLWMKDLAPTVERKHSTLYLLVLFLWLAIASNLTQYFWSGPNFLGMSGVVYGLLGFLWIRGKVDNKYGLQINQGIVSFMLIWLVFCFFSNNVANGAHVGGLLAGAAWAMVSGTLKRA